MNAPVSDLTVIVAWWDVAPPAVGVAELEQTVQVLPIVVPLALVKNKWDMVDLVRRTRRRVRVGTAHRGRKIGKSLVKVRGGTRPARAVVRWTSLPAAAASEPHALLMLREILPVSGPTLLVVTDSRAAAAAWELGPDYPDLVSVLGLAAGARLVEAVAAAGVPWSAWSDVAGDVDPEHVYAALPGLQDGALLAPHDLRANGSGPVTLPPRPDRAALLVAPANYAGQGAAWVRAAGRHLEVPAANLQVVKAGSPYSFAADHPVTDKEWPLRAVRERIAREAVGPATHVLLEAMRPILDVAGTARSGWDFEAGAAEVEALHESGRTVGVLLHGSESRRPAEHAERYHHSPFRAQRGDAIDRLTVATDTVHRMLGTLPDVPRFVSTPDMLDFVPGSQWLPVVVREGAFEPGVPLLSRPLPVVLHAPSSALMKGSDVVDAVLTDLEDEGRITYCRLRAVPPPLVGDLVRRADLVVDQIALGNLGVLALEAMACGRVVLGHALPDVMARYGEPVPLVVVDPDSLRARLLSLLEVPEEAHALALAGPEFVRTHHDGRRSAEVLATFLGLS